MLYLFYNPGFISTCSLWIFFLIVFMNLDGMKADKH